MAASTDLLVLYAEWKMKYQEGTVKEFYDWLEALQDELDTEDTLRADALGGKM